MNYLIKKYIENISITNIDDFAKKNNIFLTKNELNMFYNIIKNKYEDLLNGNDKEIITFLKANLEPKTFDKVLLLYKEYKIRYQNYL